MIVNFVNNMGKIIEIFKNLMAKKYLKKLTQSRGQNLNRHLFSTKMIRVEMNPIQVMKKFQKNKLNLMESPKLK